MKHSGPVLAARADPVRPEGCISYMWRALLVSVCFLAGIFLTMFLLLKKPVFHFRFRGRELHMSSYFAGALAVPLLMLSFGLLDPAQVIGGLQGSGRLNPAGILILFFSMVFMSVYLDTTGFFEYCARLALKHAGTEGIRLFAALYGIVSILTIFTSNDIVILTITPFVYYFAREGGIDPRPFLFAEFFAANTWSMMLYIGNPTNIVIASAFGLRFDEFTRYMLLPTIAAGTVTLLLLYLIFRRDVCITLSSLPGAEPIEALRDPGGAAIGLSLMCACILALAFAPLLGLDMWKISGIFAILLLCILFARDRITEGRNANHGTFRGSELLVTAYRLPWSIVPFVLSLFVTVEALRLYGVTGLMLSLCGGLCEGGGLSFTIIFGLASALLANLLNNIPMTIAFVPLIAEFQGEGLVAAALATTIGSNLGANITPLGSLAGLMWMSILDSKACRISFRQFIACGVRVTPFALLAALGVLSLEITFL